ncbi:hypothetical protein TrispH2_009362 [Trichoplax sp. H2]|nr:hypothetical protein TrispH2_009362 [Trichoplax sp. H2]|eukprot:RDD38432.1 hypothetical protein TrispH2_009362 [Trichoplax sp. H2]
MAQNSDNPSNDENEYYVVLQLPDSAVAGDTLRVSGIQTSQPTLQHMSNLYVGEYKNSTGTNLIFEQDQYDKQHRHISTTAKILHATEAVLKPKSDIKVTEKNNPEET